MGNNGDETLSECAREVMDNFRGARGAGGKLGDKSGRPGAWFIDV